MDRDEPEGCNEALHVDETIKWKLAMRDKIDSLLSNQTWQLTELRNEKKFCRINNFIS